MVQVLLPEGEQADRGSVAYSAAAVAGATGVAAAAEEPTTAAPPVVSGPSEPAVESGPVASGAVETSVGESVQPVAVGDASHHVAGAWASPAELLWRKWLLWGAAPIVGLVVGVGVWSILFSSGRSEPGMPVVAQPPAEAVPVDEPQAAAEDAESLAGRFDPQWLPAGTRLVFSFHPRELAGQPNSSELIDQLAPVWQPTVGTVLRGLGLRLQDVGRLTWASTDLAAWPQRSVVLVELAPGQDARVLAKAGQSVDLSVSRALCRRLPQGPWKHPFAVIDPRTIVTGEADLLRGLPRTGEVDLQSRPLRRLLKATNPDADATLLIDLAAARAAAWKLPVALMDAWPEGKLPWHVIWEMPEGLGVSLQGSDRLACAAALACEGDTAAKRVQSALDELVPAAGRALAARLESLPGKLQAGQITTATAHQYELVLKEGLAASKAARWEAADGTVLVRIDWGQGPSAITAAAAGSRRAMHADWLAAAAEGDLANHRRLLSGLGGYQKAEGHFPSGAVGGALLPPETRLSWIATMLPYLGHPEWHRRLEFGYPFNGPQNRETSQQPLPEVVNPALGPGRTEAGFPVTHYVGVAGVGPDAARLKADDPRAGVFGFGRTTRPQDIADGASNTIAVLGVTGRFGPWAAGGDPTVRALTERPYVNGPDGFGSGQPNGMFAGMADGSVRFLSKDTDPQVLEQLATIGGREHVETVAASPNPAPEPAAPVEPEAAGGVPPDGSDRPAESPAAWQTDVEARLAETIPEIELRDTPLAEAVGLLATMGNVPITFDPEAMSLQGATLRDPVTVQLSGATLGRILETVLSSRKLMAVVESGHVVITSPSDRRETLRPRRYTISDLTGEGAAAVGELAALVQELVAPGSWRSKGGRGTIEPQGGAMRVVQTAVVHDQILVFCEKLRNARGKPLRSRGDPARFALTTRRQRAARTLNLPVSVNFHQPVPLIEILGYLGQLAETDVLIDRPALAAAGTTDRADVTLTVSDRPLAEALEELLKPLGLAYRVIDAQTIQVTTPKAVSARLELEFYPAAGRLTDGLTGSALVEQIKSRLAGSTWSDAGGPGVLYFDPPSKCLIVLQSQPIQVAVERLLAEKAD